MAGQNISATPYEVLAEYERRCLSHAAGTSDRVDTTAGLWRGIGFRVGDRYLVSSIGDVNEILTVPQLTMVPGAKGWLLGVANVRGNLIPVVDLRGFIAGTSAADADSARVLMVRQQGGSVGLLVDEVLGQRNFSEEQLAAAVKETDENYSHYVGERVQLGDVQFGIFSMAALVRSVQFQQAAA